MTHYDFNLRGALHLRLINAEPREAELVQRQLGPIRAPFEGSPDLIIEFCEAMPEPPNLRYIGLNDAAYSIDDTGGQFFVLKGKNKTRARVSIPFEQIGQPMMTVRCERGLNSIPLLVPLINLTLLTKGILPLHASAFSYRDQGALITGWAKGGKTETLLAFMSRDSNYIGDEWIYLDAGIPAGSIPVTGGAVPNETTAHVRMFGIPEPIRVWNWHLDSLPHYRAQLKRKDQWRMNSLSVLSRSMDWLSGSSNGHSGPTARLAQRIRPVVNRQMFAHFAPHDLFGREHCLESAPLDQIFFTASHNHDDIRVEAIDAQEVARRMLFSITEEQSGLISTYRKFRFAFPDRCNAWLDNLERIQHKMITRILKDLPAYAVYHPYPVHIPRLFEALQPYFA